MMVVADSCVEASELCDGKLLQNCDDIFRAGLNQMFDSISLLKSSPNITAASCQIHVREGDHVSGATVLAASS